MTNAKHEFDYAELNAERVFLEQLLQQRFNFFILAFSLVVAGGTAASTLSKLNFVLAVGFVLCLLLGCCVYRAFVKVETALFLLHQFEHSCMHKVADLANTRWPLSFKTNDLMGYVVPILVLGVIAIWSLLANWGIVVVGEPL